MTTYNGYVYVTYISDIFFYKKKLPEKPGRALGTGPLFQLYLYSKVSKNSYRTTTKLKVYLIFPQFITS